MVTANLLVDLAKYVVPFFEVDTLQEQGWKSSSVELSIIQYVPGNFQPEQPCFIFILLELTVFEILDYRGHPIVNHGHAIEGLELICRLYTWLVEEFYRDEL